MKEVRASPSVNAFKQPLLVDSQCVNIPRCFKSSSQCVVVAYENMLISSAVGSMVRLVWVVCLNIPEGSADVRCEGWGYAACPQALENGEEVRDMLCDPWISVSGCVDIWAMCSNVLGIGSWGAA